MNVKKVLIFGVLFAFLVMGFLSMKRALPTQKEQRIYKAIEVYSPYKLEKRIGGLTIIDSRDGRKEKPDNASVFHRLDELNQIWGKKHLRINDNHVVVVGDNNQSITKIFIKNEKEKEFLSHFYGI